MLLFQKNNYKYLLQLTLGFFRRASEMQAKFIEEETHRRIEDVVNKRVEEELAKRKIDIDEEVMKKVEEAKKNVQQHLQIEYERKEEEILEKYKLKEVRNHLFYLFLYLLKKGENKKLGFYLHIQY